MNRAIISLIIFILLLFCQTIEAQRDTIFIYEEIIVYDTIVVYDTIPKSIENIKQIRQNTEFIKGEKAKLLLFYDNKAATISLDNIILNENQFLLIKNSESMKKLSFMGLLFFAFNSMVLSQTDYQIALNSGAWYQQGQLCYVKKPISPLLGIGFYAEKGIGNRDFAIKTGVDYSYLISSKPFEFDGTIGVWHSEENDFSRLNQIYGNGLHNFSIPLLLKYRKYKVSPSIGVNYNYLQSKATSETNFVYESSTHNFGLNYGVSASLNSSLSVNLEYRHNLTADYSEEVVGLNVGSNKAVLGESYSLRNSQLRFSVVYTLKKK